MPPHCLLSDCGSTRRFFAVLTFFFCVSFSHGKPVSAIQIKHISRQHLSSNDILFAVSGNATQNATVHGKPLADKKSSGGGYSYDACNDGSDCVGLRFCRALNGPPSNFCNNDRKNCSCIPVPIDTCVTSVDCVSNEGCSKDMFGNRFCVSRRFLEFAGYSLIDSSNDPPSARASPAPLSCRGGYTGDLCTSSAGCKGSRYCRDGKYCDTTIPTCSTSSDCECGESCIFSLIRTKLCVSTMAINRNGIAPVELVTTTAPTTTSTKNSAAAATTSTTTAASTSTTAPTTSTTTTASTPEPSPDANVCIGVDNLLHLSSDELVFHTHLLANVLCDAYSSCATPGHMVEHNGEIMMMQTYCNKVGCTRRVMHVNSPRWRRRLRISSKTEGLEFTAFAARYETRVEEKILSRTARVV